MKTEDINLTVEELNQLCRLYMACRLSVVEEKELEYVLSRSSLSSPEMDEVRELMGIAPIRFSSASSRRKWNWKRLTGIAASLAVLASVGFYLFSSGPASPEAGGDLYIAAYSNGKELNRHDARVANDNAMAKADSLIYYASIAERDCMMKANDIISETF